MEIFNKLFSKNSTPNKEIYIPDNHKVELVEVERIELTEKQAVKKGWSYCKKTKNIRITNYHGTESNIIIPSKIGDMTVNEIGTNAFRNSKIKSVEIPNSVKKIGKSAFCYSDVERVIFAEGVGYIQDDTFFSCKNLKEVHVPSTLYAIGNSAFSHCTSLEYIILPGSLLLIDSNAFYASGLKGFSISHPYALLDGSAFANTPLHSNCKMILRSNNFPYYYYVVLVGKNAEVKFPKGSEVEFVKNSVCDSCTLDLSECKSIRTFYQNVYQEGIMIDTGKPYTNYSAKAIVPFKTNNLYFPDSVDVRYPDGTRYSGIIEYMEKEGNYEYVKLEINSEWLPSWYLKTGAKKICLTHQTDIFNNQNQHGIKIDKYAINEKNVKSLELSGFNCKDEIFSPFCRNLQEVVWKERHGEWKKWYTVVVKKYIPSSELLGGYKGEVIHKRLLTSFKPVYKEKFNSLYYNDYPEYFFDSTVIDNIFLSEYIEYYDCLKRKLKCQISQRHKIFIAIDILRSTQRKYDSDTQMYSDYLRTHKYYARIVCDKAKDTYPEYLEFLNTFDT